MRPASEAWSPAKPASNDLPFPTDTDGLSQLFRVRQASVLLPECFELPEDRFRHGCRPAGSEIDVYRDLFAGGRQEALAGVKHSEEVVDSLLIKLD